MSDLLHLTNTNFPECLSSSLGLLLSSCTMCDVTLICDDGHVNAHKIVLAAASSFFKRSLSLIQHQQPLFYLRGVRRAEMHAILSYIYSGSAHVAELNLANLLSLANDLEIDGLTKAQELPVESKTQDNNQLVVSDRSDEHVSAKSDETSLKFDGPIIQPTEQNDKESVLDVKPESISAENLPKSQQLIAVKDEELEVLPPKEKKSIKIQKNLSDQQSPQHVSTNPTVVDSEETPVTCPMCKVSLRSLRNLRLHMHSKGNIQCKHCKLFFSSCHSILIHRRGRCRKVVQD